MPIDISLLANVVLTLLLFFMWLWDRSREHAMKNGLFSIRRMVARIKDPAASDILDVVDANLATLGSRKPFSQWTTEVKTSIRESLKRDEREKVLNLTDPRSEEQF